MTIFDRIMTMFGWSPKPIRTAGSGDRRYAYSGDPTVNEPTRGVTPKPARRAKIVSPPKLDYFQNNPAMMPDMSAGKTYEAPPTDKTGIVDDSEGPYSGPRMPKSYTDEEL